MAAPVEPKQRIRIQFSELDSHAGGAFPSVGTLSSTLSQLLDKGIAAQGDDIYTTPSKITPATSALFASAAIEMWLKSVQSFLISVSVTETSHVWASVSGYYASHYSVRAMAHLLGYFLMHEDRHIAMIEIIGGSHYCSFSESKKLNREHLFYWKMVKAHALFDNDPLYTTNIDESDVSDVAHRNIANYYDHVNRFQRFHVLDEEKVTERVDFLSKIQLSSVPIPRRKQYPDLDNVQLIAYHRIIRFRSFLNDVLGNTSNFWKIHRNPSWCPGVISYQVVAPNFTPTSQAVA